MTNTFIKNDLLPEALTITSDMAFEIDTGGTSSWVSADTLRAFMTTSGVVDRFIIALEGQTLFGLSETPVSDATFTTYLNGQRRTLTVDYTRVGMNVTWLDPDGVILLVGDELLFQYNDNALAPSVTTIFGRQGTVDAVASDYDASQVDNDSGVAGAFISDALDTLDTQAAVQSVFTRIGNITAAASDYAASQVDNDSLVTGAFVSDALNALRTREVFLAGTNYSGNEGDYRSFSIGTSGNRNFTFFIPADFSTLVSLHAIGIPSVGAAGVGKDIDLSSEYGTLGEASNFHSETDTTTVYDLTGTSGQLTQIVDLSIVLSSVSAGDYMGINIDHNGIGGAIDYLGIKLIYTI